MTVRLLIEHHLEFLSLQGGCTCSSESTLVKTPHCWKSHVAAHLKNLEVIGLSNFDEKIQNFTSTRDVSNVKRIRSEDIEDLTRVLIFY